MIKRNKTDKLFLKECRLIWSIEPVSSLASYQHQLNEVYKKPIADKEKNSNKFISAIKVVAGTIIISAIGVVVYYQVIADKTTTPVIAQEIQNYDYLIDNWNQKVQDITDKRKFLLKRDSNQELIEQLNQLMNAFYMPKITDSPIYNTFLGNNKVEKRAEFSSSMSRDEIKKELTRITKENSMFDIVKKVLMMNDIDIWKHNKE